jgi:hypothetical protein
MDVQAEVQAIIARARSGDIPSSWNVWPLRRGRIARSLPGWAIVALFGLVLFAFSLYVMIPDNFTPERGSWIAVLSLVWLALVAIMGFGAATIVSGNLRRVTLWGQYLLIMTPDDYVKVEPGRITHVPMDQIADITLRGVRLPHEEATRDTGYAAIGIAQVTRFLGGFGLTRRPKGPPSLAFRDKRTNRVVVVAKDDAFDDLIALEQVLQIHVGAKQRKRPA